MPEYGKTPKQFAQWMRSVSPWWDREVVDLDNYITSLQEIYPNNTIVKNLPEVMEKIWEEKEMGSEDVMLGMIDGIADTLESLPDPGITRKAFAFMLQKIILDIGKVDSTKVEQAFVDRLSDNLDYLFDRAAFNDNDTEDLQEDLAKLKQAVAENNIQIIRKMLSSIKSMLESISRDVI